MSRYFYDLYVNILHKISMYCF